jgi:hypothetical protein
MLAGRPDAVLLTKHLGDGNNLLLDAIAGSGKTQLPN